MNWNDLTPEQKQMLIDADKNKTNGPLPYSPEKAAEAAIIQDDVNIRHFRRAVETETFKVRDWVNRAQRARHSSIQMVEWRSESASPHWEALQIVKQDLIDAGWYACTKRKTNSVSDTMTLHWSTKPISWWKKLWL